MKLIGLELRLGVGGGMQVHEVKVFPVDIVIPMSSRDQAEAEITFHCDAGDVTTNPRIRLPGNFDPEHDAQLFGLERWAHQDPFQLSTAFRRYLQRIRP